LGLLSQRPTSAADASSSARGQIAAVAEALTSGDAEEAISHFSKSLPDYLNLRHYFEGLTAFSLENEVNVTDEEDSDRGVDLTITWTVTFTGLTTDQTRQRSSEIHATVAQENSKWRIVKFAPIEVFNPQLR
jgi:hypothetical protein